MEWLVNAPSQSGFIRSFFFYHGEEPQDLVEGKSPNPASWSILPQSYFNLSVPACDPYRFRNMSIIFDLTFCGDWAGNAWPGKITHCSVVVEKPLD